VINLKSKFGSVEWQNEMINKIENKIFNRIPLDSNEETFIQIQIEHNKRHKEVKT